MAGKPYTFYKRLTNPCSFDAHELATGCFRSRMLDGHSNLVNVDFEM